MGCIVHDITTGMFLSRGGAWRWRHSVAYLFANREAAEAAIAEIDPERKMRDLWVTVEVAP